MGKRLIIGAMSGTSADGVDAVLVEVHGASARPEARFVSQVHRPYAAALREALFAVRGGGHLTLARLGEIGREVSIAYAKAVSDLLTDSHLSPGMVSAIAAHGQTLYHAPPTTIQWLDPALIAAQTGIAVVSDFRRADCAAGGQGAPLVPYADYHLFSNPGRSRVMLNLGGIANLTWLMAGGEIGNVVAFDTGPANCISDHLMRSRDPARKGFDEEGRRAGEGTVIDALVTGVLGDGYFQQRPPKSTDGPFWIALFEEAVSRLGIAKAPLADLLASACEISARSILEAIDRLPGRVDEVIVSGGGTENRTLMKKLGRAGLRFCTSDEQGVPSQAKEAIAFALLGAATLDGVAGNVPSATGARERVVLGSITPAPVGNASTPGGRFGMQKDPHPDPFRQSHERGEEGEKEEGAARGAGDRGGILTEQRLVESMRLDQMPLEEAVALFQSQDGVAVAAVGTQRQAIVEAVKMVTAALRAGGRLIYFGAGTSGRLGVLDAAECPPTFRSDPEQIRGVIAGGEGAMFRSAEGAEDRPEEGAAAVDAAGMGENDVAFGIAAGGTTPFVHGALRRARERGAKTIFLSCAQCVSGEPTVDLVIRPLTGPEVVTGSTRLKAGTATKLVLNTVTTLAMVQLGKVYENLMVDLRASNVKLRDRAIRIVGMLTGATREEGEALLGEADGHVKVAVAMKLRGVDAAGARALLEESGGSLREVVARAKRG